LKFICKRGVSFQEAEDLTQQVFLKVCRVWKPQQESRNEAQQRVWLNTIALNIIRDAYRHEKCRRGLIIDSLPKDSIREPGELDAQVRLIEAVQSLPAQYQRALVVLATHDGTNECITVLSRSAHIPTATAKTHIKRGRAALRSAYLSDRPYVDRRSRRGAQPS
jgi:DNA-directed RNA polymerase specialized sigma24 family protein